MTIIFLKSLNLLRNWLYLWLNFLELNGQSAEKTQQEQVSNGCEVDFFRGHCYSAPSADEFERAHNPWFNVHVDGDMYMPAVGDIESQYLIVKDSVAHIKLPAELQLRDSHSGIK